MELKHTLNPNGEVILASILNLKELLFLKILKILEIELENKPITLFSQQAML